MGCGRAALSAGAESLSPATAVSGGAPQLILFDSNAAVVLRRSAMLVVIVGARQLRVFKLKQEIQLCDSASIS